MKPILQRCIARVAIFGLLLAGCLMASAGPASAQTANGTPAVNFNDNQLISLQSAGGDPAKPGPVKIEFYG
ncbi:MAG TPA: hypothetical protein VMJ93_18445 [Verrucomicrobiae bacterium]|nr:hypothetical protein [Verrucomicrobiae bacterium]